MKTSVAIALIVCGTVLILMPYVSSAIGTAMVASLMMEMSRDVNLTGGLPAFYHTGSFVAGLAMVIIGIAGALRRKAE